MRKEKFIYNTHTLRYEKVEESLNTKVLRVFGFICAALVTAFLLSLATHRFFPSPTEMAQRQELEMLRSEFEAMIHEVDRLKSELGNLQDRDAYAHRIIFGMEPIDEGLWEGGTGGVDRFEEYRRFRESGKLVANLRKDVDRLKRQMVLQSKSLDTITNLAMEKEELLAAIPSMKPVRSDKLAQKVELLSGFGRRMHPIFKVPRMHYGIDFTAPEGTAVQATGKGRVVRVANHSTGYGRHVIVDHGFGYRSLYAHMSRVDVKVGEELVRGQHIGLVGNTGRSTAPHLHYEVFYKGVRVDPINYVLDGLTPEEYQEMVKAAEMTNQSFD